MSANGDEQQSSAQVDVAALLAGGTATGRWVLDPARSRVQFHVKHFWGAITVHGSFAQITGEGTVGADGMVTGRLSMDAASLDTKNSRRDRHLRSADFFDADRHPYAVVTAGIYVSADHNTAGVRGDVVDAVRDGLAQLRVGKVYTRASPGSWPGARCQLFL